MNIFEKRKGTFQIFSINTNSFYRIPTGTCLQLFEIGVPLYTHLECNFRESSTGTWPDMYRWNCLCDIWCIFAVYAFYLIADFSLQFRAWRFALWVMIVLLLLLLLVLLMVLMSLFTMARLVHFCKAFDVEMSLVVHIQDRVILVRIVHNTFFPLSSLIIFS